jgi:hypothetical protein
VERHLAICGHLSENGCTAIRGLLPRTGSRHNYSMGIETSYVCDGCGEECSDDALESTFVFSVRQPPSDDVQTFFACCPECFESVLRQIQVDLMRPGATIEGGAQDAPESNEKAN